MTAGSASMSRLEARFAALKQEGRAGLVTFLTAGDPDPETSWEIIKALPAAGADVIEIGMPFSDPMADGPAIQAASQRALRNGATLVGTLDLVRRFREEDKETPIILMGYYNPIYSLGPRHFIEEAVAAGVDGLIIVDLPPEEDEELCAPAMKAGLHWIRLATPTTDEKRLPKVLENISGFLYYVSVLGITGTRSALAEQVAEAVERFRRHTDVPVAVGFGIRTPAQAAAIGRVADAVVVGSAIVSSIADSLDDSGQATEKTAPDAIALVGALAAGVRGKVPA